MGAFQIQQHFHRCVLHKLCDPNSFLEGIFDKYIVGANGLGFVPILNQRRAAKEFPDEAAPDAACTLRVALALSLSLSLSSACLRLPSLSRMAQVLFALALSCITQTSTGVPPALRASGTPRKDTTIPSARICLA